MKFVLATHNPGKLREMGEILSSLGVEVVSPADVGITVDVEETGTTFAENAMLKAKAICAASGLPAIADDSGLCVDALNAGATAPSLSPPWGRRASATTRCSWCRRRARPSASCRRRRRAPSPTGGKPCGHFPRSWQLI